MATRNSSAVAPTVVASIADLGSTQDEAVKNLLAVVDQGGRVISTDGRLDTSTAAGELFVRLLRAVQAAVGELQLKGVSGA